MTPTILVFATSRWFPTARLAMALKNAGCAVEAVCPPHHPMHKVSAVERVHTYRGLLPVLSLQRSIEAAKPDLIIPGDDLATHHLHQLWLRAREKNDIPICELIERSFGVPESFSAVYERATFMRLAHEEGVRIPQTATVADGRALQACSEQLGFPIVLKADGSSGGDGVKIARNMKDAERALRKLQAAPVFVRAAKRALVDGDKTLVWPSLLRRRSRVSAQSFVTGHEATSTVACWKGTVLAALHFEVVKKECAEGHATVMRLIDHAEIQAAVKKMVRRLSLSGVHGFDFMLEDDTQKAYLIEINPRSTQVGHLTLGPGRDLPAALYSALSGLPEAPAAQLTEKDMITLFPQEWRRDPASPFLASGYHDVPWSEPELMRACMQPKRRRMAHASGQNCEPALSPIEIARS
jgi:ATP-grasp domain